MAHYDFHAERRLWQDCFGLHIRLTDGDRRAMASNIEFADYQPGDFGPEPPLKLSTEDAQRLIDELWAAGLRPTQGKQSEGQIAATQAHLADMRTIAMHKLGIKGE